MRDPYQWIRFIFLNERYKWENHVGNHIKLQFHLQTNSSVGSDIGSIIIMELQIVIPCEFSVGSYYFLFDLHVKWIWGPPPSLSFTSLLL